MRHGRRHRGTRPGSGLQAAAHRAQNRLVELRLAPEPHLGLGRVNVHVDVVVGQLQVEDGGGETPLHEQRVVCLQQGVGQQLVAHEAMVDERDHVTGVAEGLRRLAREPVAPEMFPGQRERHEVAAGVAEHLPHAVPQPWGGGIVREPLAAVMEPEVHRGMRQRRAVHDVAHVLDLGAGGLHELEPGRDMVEQVPHLDGGPRRTARGRGTSLPAVLHAVPAPELLGSRTRHHLHGRHRGDAGQRLAAKAHGGDARQVRLAANLAGGMALEGQGNVLPGHALAVVADPDEGRAVALHQHRDLACAGIEGVVHQLLDHRRRPLHHLAGGDAVDERVGQHGDLHGTPGGGKTLEG